ncbi:MAG: glycosyltransferase family 2 protein [Thaumarchaeota archaeon]|nr:glycosyltransferase family 2 protein [Nitrososphaerota archaeon]
MTPSFKEVCIKWYCLLLSRYFPEESKGGNFIKKLAYSFALFSAKREGFLPFFFSSNEKMFNSLVINEQYKMRLENLSDSPNESDQFHINTSTTTVVFFRSGDSIHLERALDSINNQTCKNFQLIIIYRKSSDKSLDNIVMVKKLGFAKIIQEKKDEKLVDVLNKTISELNTEYVIFLDDSGILQPNAISSILTIADKEKPDLIYADEDSIDSNNVRTEPFFKPNWSPHLLLSSNYIGKFTVYKTNLIKSINGFDNSLDCNEYDLLLRACEKSSEIYRIPQVLFSNFKDISKNDYDNNSHKTAIQRHVERKKIPAIVELAKSGQYKLSPRLVDTPLISIIIPTKDNLKKLKKCLDSISKSTYRNHEIIIVSNSKSKETWKFLNASGHKVLEYNKEFNYSKINNFATKYANGEYLLFLNDDTEVITNDWLESMLLYSMQDDVGVVGSLLLFPKSVFYKLSIQHAGVSMGIAGPTAHSFGYCHFKEKHYRDFDKVVRNVSAVTAACMMIRKDVFGKVNGFDERFVIAFGDIDLCLRIRHLGYQIVYNPDVKLYHYESSTRGTLNPLDDNISFITRWEEDTISGDRFYNPNLSHLARNFRINPYFSEEHALSLLLEIHFFRNDLQQLFPDIDDSIAGLIDWAAIKGVSSDFCRTALLPYNKYYKENCSKNVRSLAEAIYLFNHDIKLQSKFPEVFSGKYENLSNHFDFNP